MLHLDASSGKLQIRLQVRPSLIAIIPACKGYANLGGNANERVHALVDEWQFRGWTEYGGSNALLGDYVVINQTIFARELAKMDTEWNTLQDYLVNTLGSV